MRTTLAYRLLAAAFILLGCVLVTPAGGQVVRTYTQELTLEFASPDDAAKATVAVLPLPDGKAWAFSARWDDNNANHVKMATAMAAEGLEGTFYLNQAADARRNRDFGAKYLKQILKPGMSVGGHTQTHPNLIGLASNEMFYEVLANRVEREAQTDRPINSFAFPFGRYTSNADPAVRANVTDALIRAGFHNTPYKDFVAGNPSLKPGEFSTTHQVVPGDHDVDPAKFDEQVDKVLKLKDSYQKISYCISLGVHAQQRADSWPKLAEVFKKYGHRDDWWYCTMTEYAAYHRQAALARVELSGQGATRTLRLTRPITADLGDDVPLTLAVDGAALAGVQGAERLTAGGRTLLSVAHAPAERGPVKIDAIDNPDNTATRPAERKLTDFPQLSTWLSLDGSAKTLKLSLENSGAAIPASRLTLRLPLKYANGIQHLDIAPLAAGEKRVISLPLGEERADPRLDEGRFYAVAELDFRLDEQPCRLFATVRVPHEQTATPVGLRDAALMAGPMDVSAIDATAIQQLPWYTCQPSDRLRFAGERATLYDVSDAWKAAAGKFNGQRDWGYVVAVEFELSQATELQLKTEGKPTVAFLNGQPVDPKAKIAAAAGANRFVLAFTIADGRSTWEPFPVLIRLTPAAGTLKYLPAKLVAAAQAPAESTLVPFVIPPKLAGGSPVALKNRPIASDADRIVLRDGRFYRGDQRFRVWGVNLGYGAHFPTHADADTMAERLESFGFNSVRIHHIDAYPYPAGLWDKANPTQFSAEALDRLDYLIDALARRGIYTNLNLHVSATYNARVGVPDTKKIANYSKVVDFFTPQLIEAEKTYARDLLGHVNAYRKTPYATDPAVAFVEINNENSLFAYDWDQRLAALPAFYREILDRQFNAWLQKRFPTTVALAEAWKVDAADPPPPVAIVAKSWQLGVVSPAKATMTALKDADGVRIDPTQAGTASWHLQLNRPGLSVRSSFEYVLSFRARSDAPRSLAIRLSQSGGAFKILGHPANVALSPEWKDFALSFNSPSDEPEARISVVMGGALVPWEIADVKLTARNIHGLRDGEDLAAGNIAFVVEAESPARRTDRMMFLAETEKAYWDSFRSLIREELKSPALLTGTMVYGAANLWAQSSLDFVDNHAYWTHPKFPPGKGFNPAEWTVDQAAMVDRPNESPLLRLAASRVAGRPFTVSEYNHSAPNDFQAECVPMIASFAAAQDWDGVWLFSWKQRTADYAPGFFSNYFEIDQNPSKLAFIQAGAVIFRDGGMAPLAGAAAGRTPANLAEFCSLQSRHGMELPFDAPQGRSVAVGQRIGFSLSADSALPPLADAGTSLTWSPGSYVARGERAVVVVQTGNPEQSPLKMDNRFAALTAVALDGRPIAQSKKVLLVVAGRCENSNMGFSPDRRTVGRNWGEAPTLIEPITGTFTWPGTAEATFTPLAADGSPGEAKIVIPQDRQLTLPLEHKTLWYLLETR